MKRGLPSGEGELDLDQLWVRRTCVLCTPNHFSFNGMFTFAHFSLSIVPEEAELMRKLMGQVSEMQAQSQIPTFHTHVLDLDSGKKHHPVCSKSVIRTCLWENSDAAVSNRDGAGGSVPVLTRRGQK